MTSWFSKVVAAIALICGCATTYGPALSSAPPNKQDVYLYGEHASPTQRESDSARARTNQEPAATGVATERPAPKPATSSKTRVAVEQDAGTPSSPFARGTYRGTDWVTIDLPGFPGSEQVDEKARVMLARGSSDAIVAFTVLDTNSGNELCTVEGSVENDLIAFEPGQACFAGILGVPMQTSLYEGEGRIGADGLEVTLGIEMTLTTPDGEAIVGDLSYRFAGKLTEPAVDAN